MAYLLAVRQATATIEDGNPEESDSNDYEEIITTKEEETLDAFSSQVIHAKDEDSSLGRRDQHDASGFAYLRWILTPGPDSAEHLYEVTQWQ